MARWRNPCLTLHGIEGPCSGAGLRTIIPCQAKLKFSIRLVPSMDPQKVETLVSQYLEKEFAAIGSGNTISVKMLQGSRAWLEDFNHPNFEAAKRACRTVHGVEPDLTREGASVPITVMLAEATKKNVCMIPLGASDDNASTENEKYNVGSYTNGIKTLGTYLEEVAKRL